ncbi:MAG: bifunctional phosphopantothenoylcysteine decarboxylase/phosphopantothenate--cysteine ligase CoaBC [Andreesenia angusta]|nr:bifunctional phosphopantothenoylcysteine decarboxylase/phosphopantothenate--cysteine ligase CoaBC [Andreesenia angusta]
MLRGKKIVLGVTGGIAAYKSPDIISRLKKKGADVKVIMTKSAEEFVTPLTFQTISQNFVARSMFSDLISWDVEHVEIAKEADLFLIAPATANIIGKIANGIADDLLTTTIMATKAKIVFAPAMNTNMYNNIIFKENMRKLEELNYDFILPVSGRLACGDIGEGKLESPEKIVEYIESYFISNIEKDFIDKKVIVTAGPTIERLDPVRYLTNNSSGKMGYEIARALKNRGAKVVLISGPVNLDLISGVEIVDIETTEDIFNEIDKRFEDIDIIIKAAAPLDYKFKNYSEEKIKKSEDDLVLEFTRNIDILKYFGERKNNQKLIGFAAETENLEDNAIKKLKEKNLDLIIANDVKRKDIGFKSDYNSAKIIGKSGVIEEINKVSKSVLADKILDNILNII